MCSAAWGQDSRLIGTWTTSASPSMGIRQELYFRADSSWEERVRRWSTDFQSNKAAVNHSQYLGRWRTERDSVWVTITRLLTAPELDSGRIGQIKVEEISSVFSYSFLIEPLGEPASGRQILTLSGQSGTGVYYTTLGTMPDLNAHLPLPARQVKKHHSKFSYPDSPLRFHRQGSEFNAVGKRVISIPGH